MHRASGSTEHGIGARSRSSAASQLEDEEDKDVDEAWQEPEEDEEQEEEESGGDEGSDAVESDRGSEADVAPGGVQGSIVTRGNSRNPAVASSRRRYVPAAEAPANLCDASTYLYCSSRS